jgi:hypothetical protein
MAHLKENEKKSPIVVTMLINCFDQSCGTFGEGKKNPLSSMTLGKFV